MSRVESVFGAFAEIADANPGMAAIVFPDMVLSYQQVKRLSLAFAVRMKESGVQPGSAVMLHSDDLAVVIASLLATSLLGAGFVQRIEGLALPTSIQGPLHFHTASLQTQAPAGSLEITKEWSPGLMEKSDRPAPEPGDLQVPWLYLYTSGTTGVPKFVGLSQASVCQRSWAVADDFVKGKSHFASLFPRDARPFLVRILAALLNGATIVDGRDIEFWQSVGVTLVSGSVAQMVSFFKDKRLPKRLAEAEIMGSRPLEADVRLLLNSFESVQDVFGASEVGKAFANVSVLAPDGTIKTVGKARDTLLEIVTVEGQPSPPGQAGILRLKNDYMAKSYIDDAQASSEAFREGWFYPGDVAFIGPEGVLRVQNREDNVINIGGAKINAHYIDEIFRSVEGIEDAICFKNPKPNAVDELFAFVVFAKSCNQLQALASARYLCEEKLGKAMVPRIIREVGGIPRKPDGAPDRKACAEVILKMQKKA